MFKLKDGYVLEYDGGTNWLSSAEEDWDIEIYNPDGTEQFIGQRYVDGNSHVVFLCSDGKYRAQSKHQCYVH